MLRLTIFSATMMVSCLPGYAEEPYSVGLENMAQTLRGDVRLIAMGDSMSIPMWRRVPMATMLAWPIPKISSLCGGAPQYGEFIRAIAWCSPSESILWSDSEKYKILRSSSTPQSYALPARAIREVYTDENFNSGVNGTLFKFKFDDSVMHSGLSGSFAEDGDQLRFRMLYWASPDPLNTSVQEVSLSDFDTHVATIDLHHQARCYWHLGENPTTNICDIVPLHINATSLDIPAIRQLNDGLEVVIREASPLTGTNKYLHPAGGIYYHVDESDERVPGFYYSFLADDGWSYSGFGSDTAAQDPEDRRFSEDQFVHWLDVTTLNQDQPVVFLWYFAVEWLHYDDVRQFIEEMIEQTDNVANSVGITNWTHMLVMPHMYKFGSLGDSPEAHVWWQETRDAMVSVAIERPNVTFASIYDATDGVLFDGSSDGNAWLLDHGCDVFEYGLNTVDLVAGELSGDLLDNSVLHPVSNDSAAFFAAVLGDIIREAGCPADIVENGIIDVHDLLSVIANWGKQGESDINQDGLINIEDLLLVIATWGDCWPVQAPFNTPAFRAMPSGHSPSLRGSPVHSGSHSPAVAGQ
jgi:hypothetical protein